MWSVWWIWIVGGVALGAAEMIIPGYIFLGFAAGAVATGLLLALGIGGQSLPVTLLVFALLSVLAWVAMRALLGVRRGQVRHIDRDINDN